MSDAALAEPVQQEPSGTGTRSASRADRGKLLASAFSIAVILAVISPVVQNWHAKPRDSFPLSYFPMFSYEREDFHVEHYLVGLDARGTRFTVHYSHIAPGGSLVRVRRETVGAMVRRGRADQLCQQASRRIVERNPRSLRRATTLQVNTGTFSLRGYVEGHKLPQSETVHATCPIGWRRA